MTEMQFEPSMSDEEALMWRLGSDPYLSSTVVSVTLLDRPPDMERLRRRMHRAAARIPRMRQRVHAPAASLHPPRWVDDPDFDLDFHLRRVALPAPSSERDLLDLAALIASDPFDVHRPLWQFTVVEGLAGGQAALIEKLHHTIADGERGIELSLEFLDFEREPAPPTEREPDPDDGDDVASVPRPADDPELRAADSVRDVLASGLRLPLGVARQVGELLADPAKIPAASAAAADTLRRLVTELGENDRARSPLWTERSLRRHVGVTSAPFDETRDVARRLGGTINTAFLTIAAEAASRYHIATGQPVDALRASMAVSTRTKASGSNAFTLVRMLVPTGELPVGERFQAIQEVSAAAVEHTTVASLDTVAAFSSALPSALVTRVARQQAQTVDFATSNVRGSPVPVFVAGARVVHNYPVGPLVGVAFNLTMLSYVDALDMGLNIDPVAVADCGLLERCLGDAIAAFIRL